MSAERPQPPPMNAFLDACAGRPTDYTPIWLMRQAGRYQPEYRAIRDRVSFLELCRTPDLACEVTVLAAEQLGVDAGIIFADILLVLGPLGVPFDFEKGEGPRILAPVRTSAQIDALSSEIDPNASLGYVMEAIRLTRRELKVPLIGFAGAPFTLASYMIEGGGSKNYYETKKLMYGDEGAWRVLMQKLSDAITRYLLAQIDAGAQVVQLFDSWVGCLSPADYRRHVLPYVAPIFRALKGKVPAIHFGTGNPSLYPLFHEAGGDVIGIDWRAELGATWDSLGSDANLMGNLDPAALLAPMDGMFAMADAVLGQAAGRPGHIFNLGHGVMPQATVDQVRALVDHVHERSARVNR